jgi:hypothetical protein
MRAGNKGTGFETDTKHPTSNMEDKPYIPPFSLRFVQGGIYIHVLLSNCMSVRLLRGYIKDMILCVMLNDPKTLYSENMIDLSSTCPIYHNDKH